MSSLEILNGVLLKPIQIWDTYCDTKLFKVHLGIRCIRKRTCNDEILKLKCGFSIASASAFCGSSMLPTLSSLLLTDETRCHLPMVAFCILYIWTCQELCLFDSVCLYKWMWIVILHRSSIVPVFWYGALPPIEIGCITFNGYISADRY